MTLLVALFILFALLGRGLAVLVNRTIDDQYGDPIAGIMPVYAPIDKWTQGASCPECWAKPAPDEAFMGTWHDSSYFVNDGLERSITITFHGSAIYAFFITVPDLPRTASEVHLNIALDGQLVGAFNFVPGPLDSFHYNQSVYSNSSVSGAGPHTLVISTGSTASPILQFDYAVYSIDDTPTPHKAPVGAIVGSVVGVFIMISALIYLLFFHRRRGRFGTPHDYRDNDRQPVLVKGTYRPHGVASDDHRKTFDSDIASFISALSWLENREQRLETHGRVSPVSTSRPLEIAPSYDVPLQAKAEIRQTEIKRQIQEMEREMADLERGSISQNPSGFDGVGDWKEL